MVEVDRRASRETIMKKALWISLFVSIFLLLIVINYYAVDLSQVREYTRNVVWSDVQAGVWRPPNGPVRPLTLSIDDLTPRQVEILLAVQDPAFYRHTGVDLSTPGAGLTTITQAIVKKLYFDPFKPGLSKIRQTLIALCAVDPIVPKDDQLRLFLNIMYFGSLDGKPIIGMEQAAPSYYSKSLKRLNENEYVSLVAMIIAPQTFHLRRHPEWNAERTRRIKKMISGEYTPRGLMDQYYGLLPEEVIKSGIAPFSYFESYYDDER